MKIVNASDFVAYLCHDGMLIYYKKRVKISKDVFKDMPCFIEVRKRVSGTPGTGKTILIRDLSLDMLLKLRRVSVYEKAWDKRLQEFNVDPQGIYLTFEDGSELSSLVFSPYLHSGNACFCAFDTNSLDQSSTGESVLTHTVYGEDKQ